MKLRTATREDIKTDKTVRAWTLEDQGRVLAVGGIMFGDNYTGFLDVKEKLPAKTFWKVAKKVMGEIKKLNVTFGVIRDDSFINSKKFLNKLGFKFYNIQNNKETYIWQALD